MSQGVVVVEAARKSGSLITAQIGLDYGREVFAVPGSIMSETSAGTNDLIKQGARLVTGPDDVLEELAPVLKGFIKNSGADMPAPELTADEKTFCELLSGEPVHVDVIARESGRHVSDVLATLLVLELKGVIRQIEGKRFHLS